MARRRGRGEGSIGLRPDGRWQGRVELGWENGKRQRKYVYGRTRADVAEKIRKAQNQVDAGMPLPDERQTVEQFLQRWLTDVAKPRVRPRTYTSYEATINLHIVPDLGKQRLAQLAPQHVQGWLAALTRRGVGAPTRRYARVVLRTALNTALRWRLVSQNAATLVDAPRTVTHEIQPLTTEQAQALLTAAKDNPLEAFVTVALSCGLRRGEALGLKWSDIDLDKATVRIRSAIQRFGGDAVARRPLLATRKALKTELAVAKKEKASAEEILAINERIAENRKAISAIKTSLQTVEPKSSRSRRTIALPSVAVKALKTHRKRQLETRLAAGRAWKERGFVFTTGIGSPMEPRRVTGDFKALLVKAGLPAFRLHDLRHSCATLMLSQGVNPRVVMETLGHSQISLTLNTYSHVMPTLQREAMAKMDALLRNS